MNTHQSIVPKNGWTPAGPPGRRVSTSAGRSCSRVTLTCRLLRSPNRTARCFSERLTFRVKRVNKTFCWIVRPIVTKLFTSCSALLSSTCWQNGGRCPFRLYDNKARWLVHPMLDIREFPSQPCVVLCSSLLSCSLSSSSLHSQALFILHLQT